mmetsp:Transcript_44959/g.101138  ORF Transcript_44959/g.101138 Transcript_44959/m.101138 type:complete len:233 (+) Transcript_44959:108-806(+)
MQANHRLIGGIPTSSNVWHRDQSEHKQLTKEEREAAVRIQEFEDQMRAAEQQAKVFDTYAICAAILTGFSCSIAYMDHQEFEKELWMESLIMAAHQWLVRVCTSMGIYSMLVFTLCAMYTRVSLMRKGRLCLRIYSHYMKRTGVVRIRAFYTMYYMALMFSFSLVLSCWYSFEHIKASLAGSSLILMLAMTVFDCRVILAAASIIFMPEEQAREQLASLKKAAEPSESERTQ